MILDILINTAITIGGAAGAVAIITGLEKLKKVNDKANETRETPDDVVVYKKPGGGWFVAVHGDKEWKKAMNAYSSITGFVTLNPDYLHAGYAFMPPLANNESSKVAWESSVIVDDYVGDYDPQGRQRITFVSTP